MCKASARWVTPKLKDAIFDSLRCVRCETARDPGLDTMACMEGAHTGSLKFGLFLGGNLYGSNPDAQYARDALSRMQMTVMLNTTMNTGHVHGLAEETIVLPVLARDEEPQPTTQESMFNFVRLSDGGPSRLPGPRSEIQVIADLGEKLLGDTTPVNWKSMQQGTTIREWISQTVPGYDAVKDIDKTKKEFQIPGRTFHAPKFATPDGKAVFHTHALPDLVGRGENELRLMTIRSEGQFNTVVYEEEDLYRGQERRDLILMNPDDITRFGLEKDQPVIVKSSVGEIRGFLARAYDNVKAGNALMYYPEANELVPRTLDPRSKTPAFKAVVVTIHPMPATNELVNIATEPRVAGLSAAVE
ncbi:MAG: molybdopterin dinucleotide binding domain-containing protein [Pirellulales bacterium]